MAQHGFHLIQSEALGEKVLLVDDDLGYRSASDLYPECVPYTHSEVGKLQGIPVETLKAVHDLKKFFRGSVSRVIEPLQ